MEIKREDIIFLDTNVIIESERVGVLKVLTGHFTNLTTVTKCVEELDDGDKSDPDYVKVDTEYIKEKMSPENVTQKEIIDLMFKLNHEIALDAGEQQLLAHIYSKQIKIFFICSPDKACIKASDKLGFIDNVISLEDLTDVAGLKKIDLKYQFTKKWLSKFKTDLLLDSL